MKIKNAIYVTIGLLFLTILLLVTVFHKKQPFWDELYYLTNVDLLKEQGFTKEFLINYKGPAGPTFAVIHYLFSPITHLQVPGIRIVNILFLVGTLLLIYFTLMKITSNKSNSFIGAISSFAIPTIYTISGISLTEIFSLFFLMVFLYLLVQSYINNERNYFLAIIAGLSLSLAILGRQPMITILLTIPLLFIKKTSNWFAFDNSKKEFNQFIIIAFCSSILLPLWVFSIWGNVQPPLHAYTGEGLAPQHLILSYGYAALYVAFLSPTYFNFKKDFSNKIEIVTILSISLLLNIFFLKVKFSPMLTVAQSYFNEQSWLLYSYFGGCLLVVMGLAFVYFFIKKQLTTNNQLSLFFVAGFFLIISTAIKVNHQFSARYVVQAFPLLLLGLNYQRKNVTWLDVFFLFVGGIVGLISLESYFR